MIYLQLFNPLHLSTFVLFALLSTHLTAQIGNQLNCENVYQVKESTTLIVLDDSSTKYNDILRRAIKNYWTISPVKYITESELPNFLGQSEYTMLLKNGAKRIERRAAGSSEIQFNEIALYPCNRGYQLSNYHARDAYVKIRVENVSKPETYLYKLGALIPAMHLYLLTLDKGEINKNNFDKELYHWMNGNPQVIHDMVLYVPQEEMPERLADQASFERYYDHPVKVVSRDSIEQVLHKESSHTAILHLHPDFADIRVVAANGRILYNESTLEYKKVTVDDIINLSRVVSGKKARKGLLKLLNN